MANTAERLFDSVLNNLNDLDDLAALSLSEFLDGMPPR